MNNSGLIYVFTGDGKGKTSAALGVSVRALAHGWNIDWVAFYKEASWNISEFSLPEMLTKQAQKRFRLHILGKGFYLPESATHLPNGQSTLKVASVGKATVIDDNTPEQHQAAAQAALSFAQRLLTDAHPPEVLVLDEVCNALDDKLIAWEDLKKLLNTRQKTHIILTGRHAPAKLIAAADLVSDITKVKHPFDTGELAVKGLDF